MRFSIVFYILIFTPLFSSFIYSQNCLRIGESMEYTIKIIDIQTNREIEENIVLKRKIGFANGFQKRIYWNYKPNVNIDSSLVTDLFELVGNKVCLGSKCTSDWIKVSEYFLTEKTGLIENKKVYWIHPPRSKYYRIMEFTPFPFFKSIDNQYSDTITLGKGWGRFEGESVVSNYVRENKDGKILIKGNSSSILGEVNSLFEFDVQKGFVKIQHNLFSKYTITMTLN